MREVTLQAEVRAQIGRRSRSLRREGKIPGIFYIHGEQNIPITVPEKSLHPLVYTSETHIINLALNNGDSKSCILRDIQFDPLTDRTIHFDLQGLREDEEISIEVPIAITGGTPVGVKEGGILQHFMHRLKIFCLPKFIPDHIEVNTAELKMNQFIHVRDLKIDNVVIEEDEDSTIAGVIPPTIEKEETVAATEEVAEPEVIGKGKKVEEGAEGEAAPATEKKTDAAAPAKAAASLKEEKKK